MASKVIVIGDINGQLRTVFGKISKAHVKNKFSFALIAGDLFAEPEDAAPEVEEMISSLLDGGLEVPLPTYFTIGKHALPQRVIERLESGSGEVCPNLYFLGRRSSTKTSEGIRIVTLGGSLDTNIIAGTSKEKYLPFHTEGDARALYGAHSADILITSGWPAGIRVGSKIPQAEDFLEPPSEQCLAELCATLKPRYHFSTSPDTFFEREPFFHNPDEAGSDLRPITRFISLASPNSASKAKWLYAFSIEPGSSAPATLPTGATASPFSSASKKRPYATENEKSYSRFPANNSGHRNSKRHRQPQPAPSECFFCLSNPNLASHLITSIASDSYLTTAKGPLTRSSTYSQLKFPAHILIIPLSHSPSVQSIPDAVVRASTFAEMQRYRSALHAMVDQRTGGSLGAVTWEVSRVGGIHVHWQFLPVATSLVDKGLVEAAFKVEADNENYPRFSVKDIGDGGQMESDYFRVWIWRPGEEGKNATKVRRPGEGRDDAEEGGASTKDGQVYDSENQSSASSGVEKSLVLPLSASFRFDLQFGRRVMAKLLGLEDRFNWRDCLQEETEEKVDADGFKAMFKDFDFSLEE